MLELKKLSIQAGNFCVLDINLSVRRKDYFVLMGETGAGKSLLVKAICGLITAEKGQVIIDGKDVTAAEPKDRQIGYVPQDSALFPHLNVERNLTFGLEVAGMRRSKAKRAIEKIVETLSIRHLLNRSTINLSGGEQQKVTLGRALARKPKLLLLDEPVSALDEPTRYEICETLRLVQHEFDLMTIHICHNIEEARLVAERIGIMAQGRLVQVGTLSELIENPSNDHVKRLLSL